MIVGNADALCQLLFFLATWRLVTETKSKQTTFPPTLMASRKVAKTYWAKCWELGKD